MYENPSNPRTIGKIIVITIVALLLIYVIAMFIIQSKGKDMQVEQPEFSDADLISQAKKNFSEKKLSGVDMSNGPCLSNELVKDWVVDVAHNPREKVDNLAENQCAAFRNGDAHHFIELDINGNFIRMK